MFWEYHLSGSVEVDFSRLEEEDQGKGSNSTEKARKPGPVVVLGTEVGMGSQTLRQTCGACLEDAWVQHGTDPLYPRGCCSAGSSGPFAPFSSLSQAASPLPWLQLPADASDCRIFTSSPDALSARPTFQLCLLGSSTRMHTHTSNSTCSSPFLHQHLPALLQCALTRSHAVTCLWARVTTWNLSPSFTFTLQGPGLGCQHPVPPTSLTASVSVCASPFSTVEFEGC